MSELVCRTDDVQLLSVLSLSLFRLLWAESSLPVVWLLLLKPVALSRCSQDSLLVALVVAMSQQHVCTAAFCCGVITFSPPLFCDSTESWKHTKLAAPPRKSVKAHRQKDAEKEFSVGCTTSINAALFTRTRRTDSRSLSLLLSLCCWLCHLMAVCSCTKVQIGSHTVRCVCSDVDYIWAQIEISHEMWFFTCAWPFSQRN